MDQPTLPVPDPKSNKTVIDTREIVRRHMEDPNHVISDEELRQVTISTENINVSEHPLMRAIEEDRADAEEEA